MILILTFNFILVLIQYRLLIRSTDHPHTLHTTLCARITVTNKKMQPFYRQCKSSLNGCIPYCDLSIPVIIYSWLLYFSA